MTKKPDLAEFVRGALQAGHSPDDIGKALKDAGWAEKEVGTALSAWTLGDLALPVPRPQPVASARDFVFYALIFGLLVFGASYLVVLLNGVIDVMMMKPAMYWGLPNNIRWALAAVITSGPLFFWLSYRDWRATRRDESLYRSVFR